MRARLSFTLLVSGMLTPFAEAQADVATDIDRLQIAYRKLGADVEVLKPRLLERTQQLPLQFEAELTEPDANSTNTEDCGRVIVLAATTSSFTVRKDSAEPEEGLHAALASVAGAAEVELCGVERTGLRSLRLEMRSPRGIIQALRVRSRGSSPNLASILLNRVPGPAAAPVRATRPRLAPFEQRLSQALARLRAEANNEVREVSLGSAQTTEGTLEVSAGCHQIVVLQSNAESLRDSAVADLDLEVFDASGEQSLARDSSENYDASAGFCTPLPGKIRLRILGASATTTLRLLAAQAPFPKFIPESFGPTGRGALAFALREAHFERLQKVAVARFLGVQGRTLVPLALETGACYLAIIGVAGGSTRALSLNVRVGPVQKDDQSEPNAPTATVAFCSTEPGVAQLEILARGQGLVWAGAVWQTARLPIGQVAE